MDAPEVGPTIASLPAWLQGLVALIVSVVSAVIFVGARIKKPRDDSSKMDEGDAAKLVYHTRWAAEHLEHVADHLKRIAEALERGNLLKERQCAALEALARPLTRAPARRKPKPKKNPPA